MKRASWACCSWVLLLALVAWSAAGAAAPPTIRAFVLASAGETPPAADAQGWRSAELPHHAEGVATAWYRMEFVVERVPDEPWALYLPYLYGGGRLFLNGQPLARILETTPEAIVRWERPHLVSIPPSLMRPGINQLSARLAGTRFADIRMPAAEIGPAAQLLPAYDRRLFAVRTMSQLTVAACLLVGTLALWIWWRRPEEVLYGLFGGATWLWGLRTLTFVVEVLPASGWHAWRTLYHAATGGFAIAMLLFAMQLASIRAGRLKWLLLAYWSLGPVGYLASGGSEVLIGRLWTGGLLPMGASVLVLSALAAWRRPSPPLLVLCAGLAVAVLAGFHDYLLATAPAALRWIAPQAATARVFLLHYAADLLLVAMGVVLATRLVGTLHAIEQLNRTLESRVAQTERKLADNFERILQLERQHAALRERQEIMRDLHDGLGSQLFLTLSRVESGRIGPAGIAGALRECIADMRLTLEAVSPDQEDFRQAWSSFRYRWEQLLQDAQLRSRWEFHAGDRDLSLPPQETIQVLRIMQEALTNVLKHAQATEVRVRVDADGEQVCVEISDNGSGMPPVATLAGHGLANMQTRAARIGARLLVANGGPGVRVVLRLPRETAHSGEARLHAAGNPALAALAALAAQATPGEPLHVPRRGAAPRPPPLPAAPASS